MGPYALPHPITVCRVSTRASFPCHVASGGKLHARLPVRKYRSVRPVLSCSDNMASGTAERQLLQIAIVGDIHSDWDPKADVRALQKIQPDLVLFVGDFGENCEEITEMICDVPFTKAAILGNHDYWMGGASVQRQVDRLGPLHVGFSRLDLPSLSLSISGSRPGSRGGSDWSRSGGRDHARIGIRNFQESAEKISEAALGAPEDHFLILMGHNGPKGLGDKCHSICGRDWPTDKKFTGGDHGDPDFAEAIERVIGEGRNVPAVVFGHMHKELHFGNKDISAVPYRTMLEIRGKTHFINAAVVPRVRPSQKYVEDGKRNTSYRDIQNASERHFVMMEIDSNRKMIVRVRDVWVRVDENVEIIESVDRYKEDFDEGLENKNVEKEKGEVEGGVKFCSCS